MIALVAIAQVVSLMGRTLSFDRLRSILVATVTHLPDCRTGLNRLYEIADAALGEH
jgi:hypothetical protein